MDRPKPFQSPLWKHIKQIDKLIEDGNTWENISQALFDEWQIKITPGACCNFYQRVHRRKKFPYRVAKYMKPEQRFIVRASKQPELPSFNPSTD